MWYQELINLLISSWWYILQPSQFMRGERLVTTFGGMMWYFIKYICMPNVPVFGTPCHIICNALCKKYGLIVHIYSLPGCDLISLSIWCKIYAHTQQLCEGGHFKNAYELLNLRALKTSMLYKNCIFQCMGKIFCVEFQRVPLKFHTKHLTHTLNDVDFIHRWKFKSS